MINNKCSGCIHCEVCDIGIMEEMSGKGYCQDWDGWRNDLPDLGELVLVKLNPDCCVAGYNDKEIAVRVESGWILGPLMGGQKINENEIIGWRKIPA